VGDAARVQTKSGVEPPHSTSWLKGRAAEAGSGVGGGVEDGTEFAGGEGVEGTKACGEFGGSELAVAIETAEEIVGRPRTLLAIAFNASGNQVAIGIGAEGGLREDVVKATGVRSEAAEAVETAAALALVDGFAKGGGLQEVEGLEIVGENQGALGSSGLLRRRPFGRGIENLLRQAHFDGMARFAAFEEAQNAASEKAADGVAGRSVGQASTASQPGDGKPEIGFAFEATVTQEVGVDGAVDDGKSETRDEEVFELLPDESGVEFGVFHGEFLKWQF